MAAYGEGFYSNDVRLQLKVFEAIDDALEGIAEAAQVRHHPVVDAKLKKVYKAIRQFESEVEKG